VRGFLNGRGFLVVVAFFYLYSFPYFEKIHSANELPRVYLVQAMVDEGTFVIDTGVKRYGGTADLSAREGRYYSNKAPGSSVLAIPAYLLVKLLPGKPSLTQMMWAFRVTTGVIPTLLFLWLLWGYLARFVPEERHRRTAIAAYALGTMAMTYSVLFIAHQLAAVLIGTAYILAVRGTESRPGFGALAACGFCAGAALLVDYQASFAGVPVAIFLLVRAFRGGGGARLGTMRVLAALAGTLARTGSCSDRGTVNVRVAGQRVVASADGASAVEEVEREVAVGTGRQRRYAGGRGNR
jgi:hypothetical protein